MSKHLKDIANLSKSASDAQYRLFHLKVKCQANARQLRRQVAKKFGMSLQKWMARERIQKAYTLLLRGEQIKVIASALGFKHQQNFTLFFIKRTGISPRAFVKSRSSLEQIRR